MPDTTVVDPLPDTAGAVPATEPVLPSERLTRLAELTAAALGNAGRVDRVVHTDRVVLTDQAMADVLAAVDASTAANTKAAYRSDWARFTAWTTDRGFSSLPAAALVVAHYVTEAAAEQTEVGKWRYAPATLTRWVSSINQFHTAAGLEAPGRAEVVRRALSGIRRIRSAPQTRRAPLLLDDLRVLMLHLAGRATDWPAAVAARRDMAILLMGFAGASRRSELVALTVSDVTLHRTDGLHVQIRHSKTDQEAHGQIKALPFGRDPVTCPPCAYVRWWQLLRAWDTAKPGERRRAVMTVLRRHTAGSQSSDTEENGEAQHCCRRPQLPEPADPDRALFPRVHATGGIGPDPMTGHAINRMIRRRAGQAGFGPAQVQLLGAIHCAPGLSPKRSGPARTPTPSCGKPGTAAQECSRSTPGNMPR